MAVESQPIVTHPTTDGRAESERSGGDSTDEGLEIAAAATGPQRSLSGRTLDARPDTADFRDLLFVPTLIEVPPVIALGDYRTHEVPILDQGTEEACTGFGLATVAHFLLRRRGVRPDENAVSSRMFYELAKRYDEWPGEEYDGSSARGAMKGWHKHGVCSEECWPYDPQAQPPDRALTDVRSKDALMRPLGAYFRVNHKDLVAMHSALAQVGILFATARVHAGWNAVAGDGEITVSPTALGGHAFAIAAYDENGFWIQNSWGDDWGHHGFGHVSYDDWLANGLDVWVARLGAPIALTTARATAAINADVAPQSEGYAYSELRPHIISIGNDGRLRESGTYATSAQDVKAIFSASFIDAVTTGQWAKKRLLLYAHGGLVGEGGAVQRVADYRGALLGAEVYPVSFIWKTDVWSTITNLLEDAFDQRKPEGFLDGALDFMLDRLDDALEPVARSLGGKTAWDEMKENARRATEGQAGGGAIAVEEISTLKAAHPDVEIHVVGHSAGAIFHAYLVRELVARGHTIASVALWAPACTLKLFKETYLPAIRDGKIERFALFTLTEDAERDDHCANIYQKSLLYLVSNAFEEKARIPVIRDKGEALLGMEAFVADDADLAALFDGGTPNAVWITAPNGRPKGSADASESRAHGAFDDDENTVRATLARILGKADQTEGEIRFHRSASSLRDRRMALVN